MQLYVILLTEIPHLKIFMRCSLKVTFKMIICIVLLNYLETFETTEKCKGQFNERSACPVSGSSVVSTLPHLVFLSPSSMLLSLSLYAFFLSHRKTSSSICSTLV
jgi:hypothetical protein